MPTLFDPLKLGALELPNRILMAPLTRSRATPEGRVPTPLQRDYYVQRASAGLIISDTSLTKIERDRILVIYIVSFFIIFFWSKIYL